MIVLGFLDLNDVVVLIQPVLVRVDQGAPHTFETPPDDLGRMPLEFRLGEQAAG
jgi:hypothetical protein